MQGKVICTFLAEEWLPKGAVMKLISSHNLPPIELITSVHLFCFSKESLLFVEHNVRGWDIPGGHIEPGEDLESALNRELLEEAGATIGDGLPFAFFEIDVGCEPIDNYRYPVPKSYIVCFLGELKALEEFHAAFETKRRTFFSSEEVRKLDWYKKHSEMFEFALTSRKGEGL